MVDPLQTVDNDTNLPSTSLNRLTNGHLDKTVVVNRSINGTDRAMNRIDPHKASTFQINNGSADELTMGGPSMDQEPTTKVTTESLQQQSDAPQSDHIEMDSRKVEPLKINVTRNREPIKTIIKLNPDVSGAGGKKFTANKLMNHENDLTVTSIVPRLTIKPIVRPQSSASDDHSDEFSDTVDQIDAHILPKLTIRQSTTTTVSEIVPKLTIKVDSHSTNVKEMKPMVSDDGIKLTIKPIPEPPIPKLTIKTTVEPVDTGSVNHLPLPKYFVDSTAGPSSPVPKVTIKPIPKPNDQFPKLTIKPIVRTVDELATSSNSMGNCDSPSTPPQVPKLTIKTDATAATVSSQVVTTSTPDDMKMIIKTTSTGACIVDPTTKSPLSPLSQQHPCPVSTSTVPKLVVRIPKENNHLDDTSDGSSIESSPSGGQMIVDPVPKLTIRAINKSEQNDIVIPKVTIKRPIDPNVPIDSSDGTVTGSMSDLITPKITIKSIPKPLDVQQALEVVTHPTIATVPTTITTNQQKTVPIMDSVMDHQHSPRIILRINKVKEGGTVRSDSMQTDGDVDGFIVKPDLKRMGAVMPVDIEAKRTKIDGDAKGFTVNEVINLDSDDDDCSIVVPPPVSTKQPITRTEVPLSLDESKTKLKGILNRIHQTMVQSDRNHQPITTFPPITQPIQSSPMPITLRSAMTSKSNQSKSLPIQHQPPDPLPNFRLMETVDPIKIHPLLMQNIERAQLLGTLMNVRREVTPPPPQKNRSNRTELLAMNEGSSSDCIILEDNLEDNISDPMDADSVDRVENGRIDRTSRHQETSVDRDSGVDVSNSIRSNSGGSCTDPVEIVTPPVKRGRGRPRKEVATVQPNKNVKKPPNAGDSKTKFLGLLIDDQSSVNNIISTDCLTPNNKLATNDLIYPIGDQLATVDPLSIDPAPSNNNVEGVGDGGSDPLHATLTTPLSIAKRRRIVPDDDDESPTFHPLARIGGPAKRGGRGRGRGRGTNRPVCSTAMTTPKNKKGANGVSENSRDATGVFQTPEGKDQSRRKNYLRETLTPALQVFEEDTRMSSDSLTPMRQSDLFHNDESQSSLLSSASVTAEGTVRKRGKLEVIEQSHEFTADMIAEYDWPATKTCSQSRTRDTFMIQEQVAEYLGVKSFKRKYPDLNRRMVDMEERNYLMEKGMVSEKMCDLGLTAVLASDVLDIMHNDFYDKYEDYKKHLRARQIRELAAKQKLQLQEAATKNLSAREHAIRAASSWNSSFNKTRKEDRRSCLDLQSLIVQLPTIVRKSMNHRPLPAQSNYPVALVPGQFQEHYRTFSAAELLCYPINTAIAEPYELDKRLRVLSTKEADSDSESGDNTSSDSSSNSDDSSSDSDTEVDDKNKNLLTPVINHKTNGNQTKSNHCLVCNQSQHTNSHNRPELFIKCTSCRRKAHPSCIEMPPRMFNRCQTYPWQCSECKHCTKCRKTIHIDKMIYCDQCDRGFHIFCIGMKLIPEGRWHCNICSICTSCGARRPEGHKNPNLTTNQRSRLLALSKWNHNYRIDPVTKLREHSDTLCLVCWKKRQIADKADQQ